MAGDWRRTADGWQAVELLQGRVPAANPPPITRMHPMVIALIEVLASIGVLLFFEPAGGYRERSTLGHRRTDL